MAVRWLDAARYADTNGYQSDGERYMWRWRDWVIDAFNRNMPFDQFTIEQIAGDLLPDATLDQKIATGFNRNHRGNGEGGVIPEEYAVEYVVDRVDTTSTVWLGLTLGCARCHDHKYDPITQKEFYQVFAFFNNVPEKGKAVKYRQFAAHDQVADARAAGAAPGTGSEAGGSGRAAFGQTRARADRGPKRMGEVAGCPPADRLDTPPSICPPITPWTEMRSTIVSMVRARNRPRQNLKNGQPAFLPGRVGQAGAFDGQGFIDAGDVGDFGFYDKFSLGAWIYPTGDKGGAVLSRMTETDRAEGYSLYLEKDRIQLNLFQALAGRRAPRRSRAPVARQPVAPRDGDLRRLARGGGSEDLRRRQAGAAQDHSRRPEPVVQVEGAVPHRCRLGGDGRFRGQIDDVRVYSRVLSAEEVEALATPDSITAIAGLAWDRRSRPQSEKLEGIFSKPSRRT